MSPATPTDPNAPYVLGTDEAELRRLGFQHNLWADLAQQSWRAAAIAPGQTVLDLGCGPGHATFDLASHVGPAGRVIAIDQSQPFINYLQRQIDLRGATNVHAHCAQADQLDTVPLADSSIDLIFTRWMLCFAPRPDAVIAQCTRVLKPAGRLCVNDYFNYTAATLAPRRAGFTHGINVIAKSWKDRGGDSDIVGRLPTLCASCGLTLTYLKVDQRIARPGETMWQWGDSFWTNFIPRLVESAHLSQTEADAFLADWRQATDDPNSFFVMPTMFALIVTRPRSLS